MSLSTATNLVFLNSAAKPGAITLPLTTTIPGRTLTLKDTTGAAAASTITISTSGGETFEDGTTSRTITTAFGSLTITGNSGKWYTTATSQPTSLAVSTLSTQTFAANSTILKALTASTATISSLTAGVLTASTIQAPTISSLIGFTSSLQANTISSQTVTTSNVQANVLSSMAILTSSLQANTLSSQTLTASNVQAVGLSSLAVLTSSIQANTISSQTVTASNVQANFLSSLATYTSSVQTNTISSQFIQTSSIQANGFSSVTLWASTINGYPIGAAFTGSTVYLSAAMAYIQQASVSSISANTVTVITLSTMAFNVSSINGLLPTGSGSTNYLSAGIALMSSATIANVAATQGYISSLVVDSFQLGSNAAFINMGDVIATSLSTIQLNTGILYTNSTLLGNTSNQTAIQFYGNSGNYNNTALAEISTGVGTQEFVVFRGSSVSDRIRMQTTGSIVFETGVASRLWPTAPSNATPALIINTASNVGIQTATPAFPLDVAGIARSQILSTFTLNVSSINGQTPAGLFLGSSVYLSSAQASLGLQVNISSIANFSSGNITLFSTPGAAISSQLTITDIQLSTVSTTLSQILTKPTYQVASTTTYSYTGGYQTLYASTNWTHVFVQMWGAGGAGGLGSAGLVGGGGAYVQGYLPVTQGDSITLIVGQGGQYSAAGLAQQSDAQGGGGGSGTNAGQGGGRTAITRNFTDVVVAGGGGAASGTAGTGGAATWSGTAWGAGNFVRQTATYLTSNAGGGGQTVGGSAAIAAYSGIKAFGGTTTLASAGGGGAGWYGGGGSANASTGAGGGSSYTDFLLAASGYDAALSTPGFYLSPLRGAAGAGQGGAGIGGTGSNGLIYITPFTAVNNYKLFAFGTTLMPSMTSVDNVGAVRIWRDTIDPNWALDVGARSRFQYLEAAAVSTLTVNTSNINVSSIIGTSGSFNSFSTNTGSVSTLTILNSLNMSNTAITNAASLSFSPMYNATNFAMPTAGGTYSTYVSSSVLYALFTFTTPGPATFTPTGNITGAQLLVVGGGGSGGGPGYGGGGGAGGLVYASGLTISAGSYPIVVGAGGSAIVTSGYNTGGYSGNNSSALGYTGVGGGGGGSDGSTAGKNGGCGGGGGYMSNSAPPGIGSQGYNGGSGDIGAKYGGGGGGMGSAGSNFNSALPSVGGAGVVYSITGVNAGYAAGGGSGTGTGTAPVGGSANGSIIGGTGGAGASQSGTAGAANTGSGGGGSQAFSPYTSGAGATGIVVIAYPLGSAFSYNVGSVTGDANSNLSLQPTNKLSITGNTTIAGTLSVSTFSTALVTSGTVNTTSMSTSIGLISSLNVNSLTAIGATVNKAGLTTSNTYGTGSDTLTIQTTAGGNSGGTASLYFGTPTYGYPLGRIAALDQGSTYDTSALIFQNATITANSTVSGTFTFQYVSASPQTYTVPAGVTSITVKMWGAGGGSDGVGGAGAYLTGNLAVTPGQVISLIVGASGQNGGYGGGGPAAQSLAKAGGGRSAIQITCAATITGVVGNGTTATYTTSSSHGLIVGEPVILSGLSNSGFNGTYAVVSVPTTTSFTLTNTTNATITAQSGTIVAELVDVGGGGGPGGSASGNQGGNATYTGTAASGAGTSPGGGGTQTSGGAAGGTGATAGSLLQGGTPYRADYYSAGGGGGGYYGGGGAYYNVSGPAVSGGGGGGSSWSGLLTNMSGANSIDGYSPPGTGVAGYITGVASGSSSGNGLIIIVVPPAYNLSETMRISNNGYLGIGTSTPAMLLDVAGSARASTIASGTATLSSLSINDRTTLSTGSMYQISSVLYYNNTVIGGTVAANLQTIAF